MSSQQVHKASEAPGKSEHAKCSFNVIGQPSRLSIWGQGECRDVSAGAIIAATQKTKSSGFMSLSMEASLRAENGEKWRDKAFSLKCSPEWFTNRRTSKTDYLRHDNLGAKISVWLRIFAPESGAGTRQLMIVLGVWIIDQAGRRRVVWARRSKWRR